MNAVVFVDNSSLQYQECVFVDTIVGPNYTAVSTKFVVTVLEILSPPDLLTEKNSFSRPQTIILF